MIALYTVYALCADAPFAASGAMLRTRGFSPSHGQRQVLAWADEWIGKMSCSEKDRLCVVSPLSVQIMMHSSVPPEVNCAVQAACARAEAQIAPPLRLHNKHLPRRRAHTPPLRHTRLHIPAGTLLRHRPGPLRAVATSGHRGVHHDDEQRLKR